VVDLTGRVALVTGGGTGIDARNRSTTSSPA
jgi:hypothetical protein